MFSVRSLLPVVLACSGLLTGCVTNPYQRNYTSLLSDKVPKSEPSRLLPAEGAPQLLTTQDMRKDAIKLTENGYLPIGRSKFKEQLVDARSALQQAALVGAAIVIVEQKHAGTSTYTVPVDDWVPDRHIIVNETTRIQGATPEAAQTLQRESITTITGEYQTHYENQAVEYYDHSATFWKKSQPPILGVLVSELDDDQRKSIQSNKGVAVKVVVRKSPAFLADLLRGDIIRRFAGGDVLGVEDFFERVVKSAGKTVELELWRDGKKAVKKVELQGL